MFRLSADITNSPFNNFLKDYGFYVALGVAIIILLVIVVLFALSKNKEH